MNFKTFLWMQDAAVKILQIHQEILLPQTLSLAIPHAGGGEFSRLSFRGLTRPRR